MCALVLLVPLSSRDVRGRDPFMHEQRVTRADRDAHGAHGEFAFGRCKGGRVGGSTLRMARPHHHHHHHDADHDDQSTRVHDAVNSDMRAHNLHVRPTNEWTFMH